MLLRTNAGHNKKTNFDPMASAMGQLFKKLQQKILKFLDKNQKTLLALQPSY